VARLQKLPAQPRRQRRNSVNKLSWIKRRARRLQNFYQVSRRMAVYDAWIDWINFTGSANA
jgi:hypothetical protein